MSESDDWDAHWQDYAVSNAQNPAQAYRRKVIFEQLGLDRARGPVRLIDLGSGSGELAAEVLRRRPDAEVLGLDLSESAVALARSKVPSAAFVQQDFSLPISLDARYQGWATHVVCSEVLEHLDAPAAVLRNVLPFLVPGCQVVITVPAGPMSAFDKHIGHRRHFEPDALAKIIAAGGLDVRSVYGAGFPFFNLYRLVVVARGKALVQDASGDRTLPLTARAAMRVFSLLFRLNTSATRLGWQLVAVGVKPKG